MKLKREDFQVMYEQEGCYRVQVRETFLWIFTRWVFVTHQVAEHLDDEILEFETFKEATNFIDNIAE